METFHVDYHGILLKEQVAEQHSLVEITSGVVPQVENEVFHSAVNQLPYCLVALLASGT